MAATHTFAEDRFPSIRSDTFEWGLGIGALMEDEGYRGVGYEINPNPVLYVNTERFRFIANQADYEVIQSDAFILSVKAEARFDGFEEDDDAYFEGMEDRDGGLYGGLRAEYKTGYGNLVGEYVTELAGDSNGSYGSVGAYWIADLPVGELVPKVAVEYYSSDYTGYYYGVQSQDANPERPEYSPGSAINYDFGVDYVVDFAEHHKIISSAKYRAYGSDVKDSPLIDASGSARFILGYLYTF